MFHHYHHPRQPTGTKHPTRSNIFLEVHGIFSQLGLSSFAFFIHELLYVLERALASHQCRGIVGM